MKRLLIAGVATIALMTSAFADISCKRVDDYLDADTGHCRLRVDGRTVMDGTCNISIAHDGREFDISDPHSGTEAQVAMKADRPGRPYYGYWNRGIKSDVAPMVNFGEVKPKESNNLEAPVLFQSKRFQLSIAAPYFNCDQGRE